MRLVQQLDLLLSHLKIIALYFIKLFYPKFFSLTCNTKESSVTGDPGSKPDYNYARLRDRQIYIRKIKV